MKNAQLREIRSVIYNCVNDAAWMRDEDKLHDHELAPTCKEFKERLMSVLVEIDQVFKEDF